ncbi:MAG: energy-coupling factor transporter transmembrane component T [Clostridia bacterium]|nr:energy-coupling factor transporter transmembrane component T [Clostridia bacterium]
MRAFEAYHPIVLFVYFTAVIVFSMFYMHPVYLSISLCASIMLSFVLNGRRAFKNTLLFALPMFLIIAVCNPLFSHKGVTPLFYIDYNPITLEAIMYGLAMAAMIMTVIFWFSSYNAVMTTDKFICLFGSFIPSIALIISMTLRLVPKFKEQTKRISNSQKAIGMYITTGNILQRAKSGLRILSILITWALENAIDTADSMKARGYGLKGRSSFSLFKFEKRDGILLGIIAALVSVNILGEILNYSHFDYYPYITDIDISWTGMMFYLSYLILMILPAAIEIKEEIKWRLLMSKI